MLELAKNTTHKVSTAKFDKGKVLPSLGNKLTEYHNKVQILAKVNK